jgi:hypothetical protein
MAFIINNMAGDFKKLSCSHGHMRKEIQANDPQRKTPGMHRRKLESLSN